MTQVQYLGYIIDECGVHVDPTKIQVIQDWPAPTTLIELHNFLGLANFYRMFVLGVIFPKVTCMQTLKVTCMQTLKVIYMETLKVTCKPKK